MAEEKKAIIRKDKLILPTETIKQNKLKKGENILIDCKDQDSLLIRRLGDTF